MLTVCRKTLRVKIFRSLKKCNKTEWKTVEKNNVRYLQINISYSIDVLKQIYIYIVRKNTHVVETAKNKGQRIMKTLYKVDD